MITNKDIITGLHRKRNAANGILDSMKRKPRIDLQAISERKWRSFIKTYGNINESPMKGMDEMPKGKLEDEVIIMYGNGDRYIGEVKDRLPHGHGTIVSPVSGEVYSGEWQNAGSTDTAHLYGQPAVYLSVHGKTERCTEKARSIQETARGTRSSMRMES